MRMRPCRCGRVSLYSTATTTTLPPLTNAHFRSSRHTQPPRPVALLFNPIPATAHRNLHPNAARRTSARRTPAHRSTRRLLRRGPREPAAARLAGAPRSPDVSALACLRRGRNELPDEPEETGRSESLGERRVGGGERAVG